MVVSKFQAIFFLSILGQIFGVRFGHIALHEYNGQNTDKGKVPFLVFGFGACSIACAFVQNHSQLYVARVFLGVFEGGTLPGIAFFLSGFYRRQELMFRIGIFISGSSMSGAFGGLLATGLA